MNKKTNSDLIKSYTDSYFLKSKEIIKKNGDIIVTYAIFIRRPGIIALKIAIDWIKQVAEERKIKMTQLRTVSRSERVVFPLMVLGLCILLLPAATPLIGALMFGNLLRESGVVGRLSSAAQNELINIVTIFLGLAVGSKLGADKFLKVETLGILALGLVAFVIGTATGVLLAKVMNKLSKREPINPLIGAAGVSAVPMVARVVNQVGLEARSDNMLLMHAMGPNVSGVIGSAVAAGVLLAMVGV